MRCPRCQCENPVGQKFCGECGARLAASCPGCGASNPPGQKFCGECGAPLTAAEPGRTFGSPESYTPKHLAERILSSRSALEGERKQVTVLFADLKGSMELLADRDPEEARKILDPVVERMMEAVHHYEGTVNQVMGDGIMALFGAPIGHEDHAVRACYAALRMQRRVTLYADEIQRGGGTPVQIRVGLNSGEVVVGSIRSDLHMDYTAVGQTTHLAARMEQMAKPGSVLVTGDTLTRAEGYVQVRPLGAVTVKGLETSRQVYELLGLGPARFRLQASAARGLTRFVGRTSELQQLAQALERAVAGHGQMVAIVGEAGVGKSRLVWEFTRSHHTHGWLILESGSVSYGKATPYLPVIDLLKSYFGIQDRDGQREIRERVAGKLLTLDRALEPLLPPLLALLDVPIDDPAWAALDPTQRRQRTLDAVKRVLLRESQVQPLLVLFEDLHWIDSETQALLDGLIESLPTSRVLLLVNYRPEYEHAWGRKTYYCQLRIDPLPPERAEELLHALLGEDGGLEPLKRLLIERTEGNPFFLEESVRTLIETAALVGERGGYRLARPLPKIQVPATVQTVLAARIDRLPPADKAFLQVASVMGKDVPIALLQAIAELSEDELHAALGRLQAAEFLYETSLFPDLEYTFKHALTHEVAYGSLLQERRCALHAKIVEAIEQLYVGRLDEQVERLAHHALRGEMWGKAVSYLRQAGAKAFAQSANREAVVAFEQALDALANLPESRDSIEQAIDLRFNMRNSLWPLAEFGRIFEQLHKARTLIHALNDQPRLGRVSAYMAGNFWRTGDQLQAIESSENALGIAAKLGDSALEVLGRLYLGLAYHALGDYRHAVDVLMRNVASLAGDLDRERFGMPGLPSVVSRAWVVWSLAERGEFADGLALGEEAARIAEAADQPYSLTIAYLGLGIFHLRRGELSTATSILERGLRLCEVAGIPLLFRLVAAQLGNVYALSGRLAEALALLERVVEQAATMSAMFDYALAIIPLCEAYLLAGHIDDAIKLGDRALDLSCKQNARGHQAYVLRLLGEIGAHCESPEITQTEDRYLQAIAMAHDLGMRPLLGHCHLGLGRVYWRTAKRKEAQEHLITATTMFREMDMRFWLKKAHADLKELG
jgi:class 3 adenylate cyclase/tetratricopeptide (TPR) repeat protein